MLAKVTIIVVFLQVVIYTLRLCFGMELYYAAQIKCSREFLGEQCSYQLVGTSGNIPIHAEHPAMQGQSSEVVTTEENSPVVSPHDSNKASAALMQSQLKGVNKVILFEGVSILARSEIIIESKAQAKVILQVGMNSSSKSDNVRHLKGLHVAHLVVTPVGKTVPIRIANTTTEDIEISKGCKLAEFCPLIEQEVVDNTNFPVKCNAVQADNLADNIDSSLDPGLSNS